jgi:hypothetical protein
MIISVAWKYVILTRDASGSYRVKKRTGGAPPVYEMGIDTPSGDYWTSSSTPPSILYSDERRYNFFFWSLIARNTADPTLNSAQVQFVPNANMTLTGGPWSMIATAYYVYDFGSGTGDNVVVVDAYDIQLGDFIPDDFVKVSPDTKGLPLTTQANQLGFIDTSKQIPQGRDKQGQDLSINIKADDILPAKQFAYWQGCQDPAFFFANDKNSPPLIGTPPADRHDIIAHYYDIVVAYAFYNETPPQVTVPPNLSLYNFWWWFETHFGLVLPGPTPVWRQQLLSAAILIETARKTSPQLQASVLEVAVQQLAVISSDLKKEIKSLQKRKS